MDAPMGSAEFEESDELERLRRRAYGPGADIAGDAAAQDRLSELEAAQRQELIRVVVAAARVAAPVSDGIPDPEPVGGAHAMSIPGAPPVDGSADPQPARGSVTEEDPADGPIADSNAIEGVPAAPWWRRRRWLAILGVAIVALAVNAALIVGTTQLIAIPSTPLPTETSTARIPPIPAGFEAPYGAPDYVLGLWSVDTDDLAPIDHYGVLGALDLSPDELERYEDFQGLNFWSGRTRDGMNCLFVAVPGQGLREGLSADMCSADGFDTIAELVQPGIGGYTASTLFDGLPTGGLMRFVLRGDHLDVYMYVRDPDPKASQG